MKVNNYLDNLIISWDKVNIPNLEKAVEKVQESLFIGKSVFVVGNGGSSSTAAHFVADWVKGNREKNGIIGKAFCLSDNTPIITAIGNDFAFDQVFAYQLKTYANAGDLLVCVTGSGNSPNIVNACKEAKLLEMSVVGLTGYDGGETANLADFSFHCPVDDMQIIEDMHMSFGHMVIRCQN